MTAPSLVQEALFPITEKKCARCLVVKSLDEFHQDRNVPSGIKSYCKECSKEKNREWSRLNPERMSFHNRKGLLRRHHITFGAYSDLLVKQDNKCAICGGTDPGKGKFFQVDHDHTCCPGTWSCGTCVRGLLCSNCNTGLGMFKDSVERLQAAISYLQGEW